MGCLWQAAQTLHTPGSNYGAEGEDYKDPFPPHDVNKGRNDANGEKCQEKSKTGLNGEGSAHERINSQPAGVAPSLASLCFRERVHRAFVDDQV